MARKCTTVSEQFLPILSAQVQIEMTDILNETPKFLFFELWQSGFSDFREALKRNDAIVSWKNQPCTIKSQEEDSWSTNCNKTLSYADKEVTQNVASDNSLIAETYQNWKISAKLPMNDAI